MDGIWLSDLNTLSLVHNSLDWAFPRSWSPCMWKLDQVYCPNKLGFASQWIPCWIVASVQAEGAEKLYMCLMLLIPANDSTSRVEVGGGGFKPNPPLSYPHLWFPVSVMLWLISIFFSFSQNAHWTTPYCPLAPLVCNHTRTFLCL